MSVVSPYNPAMAQSRVGPKEIRFEIRLTKAQAETLDHLAQRLGLVSRAGVVSFALARLAQAEGIVPSAHQEESEPA